ncbi:TonB-dependent receptor [Dysgonomonas sp. 520]|uniref:TonB-dependent receptor n=1 Tax=Dysgonomonas sp. 520 TaxID=2302931 RepID=UPI0013D460BF|nr:TonB-dependent receptor [Dysgonomonas sp. 520]NDW09049.1 TonB-dependent receptor [Dysgonomonas sp. 520]
MKKEFLFIVGALLMSTTAQAEELMPDSVKQISLEEVTISAIRAGEKTPIAFSNVSSEEIQKRNMGQDVPYILALTPSFVPTSDAGTGVGYTGFRIRGTDANRVNITVNGVPLNDAESHGAFFVNLPDFASSLSSMQVQRGVGTSTNGAAALGGSINMKTETLNSKAYGEINSSYGSFNTNKNTLKVGTGLMDNKFSFDARLSNVTSDGYVDRASADMKAYYFAGGYYNDKTVLKFITFGGKEETYQAWNGVSKSKLKSDRKYNDLGEYVDDEGNIKYYKNQNDNYKQTHYQLHWAQELSPKMNLNAAAHYTRGLGYYEEYKQDRKYEEYGLTPAVVDGVTLKKTDLIRQKWLDNYFYGLTFALNYQADKLNASIGGAVNSYDGEHYGKVIWARNAQGLDINDDWYRNTSRKSDANIYAKVSYEAIKNLHLTADLQGRYIYYKMKGSDDKYDSDNKVMRDITQKHTFFFFNPKVGATYQINQQHDVYASFSIANREPNRNNYTDAGKNEKPTNERLYDTELGYRFHSPRFSAGANLYYMKYKDQLILNGKISEIGEMLTSNIPDSYRMGIEFVFGAKITNWLKWDGNLTLSRNKVQKFTEQDVDVYETDADGNWVWTDSRDNYLGTSDIAFSPNVIANSLFTFTYKKFEAGLHTNYVGKQYIDNTSDNGRSLDAYFINNLSFRYSLPLKFMKSIDFQFTINNLFNEKYESNAYTWYSCYVDGVRDNDLRYFPQAGTNVLGSIALKF